MYGCVENWILNFEFSSFLTSHFRLSREGEKTRTCERKKEGVEKGLKIRMFWGLKFAEARKKPYLCIVKIDETSTQKLNIKKLNIKH